MTVDHHEYCTGGFSPDDVVISGISGRFPECRNVGELKEALMTQKNIILVTNERYDEGAANQPFCSVGTMKDADKFDVEFFGYSNAGADNTDPKQRIALEVSYEAMADAGYEAMSGLEQYKIGSYTSVCNDESRDIARKENAFLGSNLPGYGRCMLPSRLAHAFDFCGPNLSVDSGCSSSSLAMWSAYNDIKHGRVDAALVTASQMYADPLSNLPYDSLGVLSRTYESNPFDARGGRIIIPIKGNSYFDQRPVPTMLKSFTRNNMRIIQPNLSFFFMQKIEKLS